ncbi:hypothetical protein TSOC_004154 [Tetrabaena socialis]|uniref:Uncharacterized protein n=1 Tax=Tetrabaena socialis TaxID=47790 RepID=A0A2J8A9M8_9CHLO|nr:hypothetical protein TSOC_004154 [Tetrabaena socialis]|eukprot:PNH09226.1 hypothetical protein TSOC_004154 [Tetrabaena socialis]
MSSSTQQPVLSRPAQAAAILRSLPGLAERLRASPPPSIEELRELAARLKELLPLIGDGTAAPALLSNAAARAALLNVLAVALRQLLPSSAGAPGSGAAREEELWLFCYTSVAFWGSICCSTLLTCKLSPLHSKRQLGFLLRLVRTQPLQCCALRLADVGPELLSLQQAEGEPQEGARGRAASNAAARAHDRQQKVVCGASDMLVQSLPLVFALAVPLDAGGGPPSPHNELGQLWKELASAFRDSCMLEHVARTLLLLLLPSQRVQPAGDGDSDNFRHASALGSIISRISWMASFSALADDAFPSATSEPSTLAAALLELLSGRCVRHAVLVLGVAALCAADGGPSYGLPSELLRHVPVIGQREGPDGARGEAVDLRHTNGRMVLESLAVENMVHVLRRGVRSRPPGRQGTLALLLRVGRLVAASGRAHLGACGGSAEAETTAHRECGGSACGSRSGSGCSSGSGSGSGRSGGGGVGRRQEQTTVPPQLPRPPATPGLQLRLGEAALRPLFNAALEGAMELCFPARPAERPERAAARVECWQLFAAYTRDVLPLPLDGGLPCSPVQHLRDPGAMLPGAPLPASPPPSWADALAGGWLPCLERLLHRGGEDPAGPEMRLAVSAMALFLPDGEPSTRAWRHFAVLLAYGEPRQAAVLVATLGKLLYAADLSALLESTTADNWIAAAAAMCALEGAVEEWEAASGAATFGAMTAALPAQSAANWVGPATGAQAQFPWWPQQLQALASSMRAEGWDADADGAEALAALLQSWEADGSVGVDEGELAGAEVGAKVEGGASLQKPMGLLAAWRHVEECSAVVKIEQRFALALVPVAEARGALHACSC